MFIQYLQKDPLLYVSIVVTVIVSIILHELAHGWAAIWQGDDTPIRLGHMTVNPMVHMGGFALAMLVLIGIAYGQMPVNPSRFRSRYGDALVSVAGPAMNLLLAFVGLTSLGIWEQWSPENITQTQVNAREFLWLFGTTNIVLCLFNLIPVPPLDGSTIVATFHPGYAKLVNDPSKHQVFFFAFLLAFIFAGRVLFDVAAKAGSTYLQWVTHMM